MANPMQRAWKRRMKPLVLDRRFDVAFLCLWFLYGAWGITTAIINTTFLGIPVGWYPTLWGTAIGISAIVACCAIVSSLFTEADRLKERIREKHVEAIAVACLGGLVVVHPILQGLRLFTEFPPRPDTVFLGLSYMVMIIYRMSTQLRRAQELRILDKRYQDEQEAS